MADFRQAISDQLGIQIADARRRAQEVTSAGASQLLLRVADEAELALAAHDTTDSRIESIEDAIQASRELEDMFTKLDQADAVSDVIEGRSERLRTQADTLTEAEAFHLLVKEIGLKAPEFDQGFRRFQALIQSSQSETIDTAAQAITIVQQADELAASIRIHVDQIKEQLVRDYHRLEFDRGVVVFLPKVFDHKKETISFVMADRTLSTASEVQVSIHSTQLDVDRSQTIGLVNGDRFRVAVIRLLPRRGGDATVTVSVVSSDHSEDFRERVYIAPGTLQMVLDAGAISGVVATVMGGMLIVLGREAEIATLGSVGALVFIFLARFLMSRRRRERMLTSTVEAAVRGNGREAPVGAEPAPV